MRRMLALLATSTLLAGCVGKPDLGAAQAFVATFHRQYNAGEAAAIYADGSDELKRATPPDRFTLSLTSIRRKLSPAGASTLLGSNVTYSTSGTYLVLLYKTQFARGQGVENFSLKIEPGGDKLFGYHVNSDALFLN